jgi:hypothetical protein
MDDLAAEVADHAVGPPSASLGDGAASERWRPAPARAPAAGPDAARPTLRRSRPIARLPSSFDGETDEDPSGGPAGTPPAPGSGARGPAAGAGGVPAAERGARGPSLRGAERRPSDASEGSTADELERVASSPFSLITPSPGPRDASPRRRGDPSREAVARAPAVHVVVGPDGRWYPKDALAPAPSPDGDDTLSDDALSDDALSDDDTLSGARARAPTRELEFPEALGPVAEGEASGAAEGGAAGAASGGPGLPTRSGGADGGTNPGADGGAGGGGAGGGGADGGGASERRVPSGEAASDGPPTPPPPAATLDAKLLEQMRADDEETMTRMRLGMHGFGADRSESDATTRPGVEG